MISQQKLNNIHKLNPDEILQIMHECAEALGVVSTIEYCKIMGSGKRAVYQKIKENKIITFTISGKKFPCINTWDTQ